MDADDVMLVYLATPASGGVSSPLDPVRIMKGIFLLTRWHPELEHRYEFSAYHYGPFSSDVYRSLDRLVSTGRVSAERVPGRSWCRYAVTQLGEREAARIRLENPSLVTSAVQAKTRVMAHSFQELLREIYKEYPAFAARTVVPELRSDQ